MKKSEKRKGNEPSERIDSKCEEVFMSFHERNINKTRSFAHWYDVLLIHLFL